MFLNKKQQAEVRRYSYPTVEIKIIKQIKRLHERSIYIIPKQISPKPFNYPPSVIVGYFGRGKSKQLSDRRHTGREQHAEMWADIQQRYKDAYLKMFGDS